MKKFLCVVLALTAFCCFASCAENPNDGVCDHKDCDATLLVERYDKDHEYCPQHLLEWLAEEAKK